MGLAMLALVGFLIWTLLPESWTDPWKYSVIYGTNSNSVNYISKPKDCEFIHAPLGEKSCHYDKGIHGYNAAGVLVAGDDAPQYSISTLNKPIVSYDNGKSWRVIPEGERRPDATVVKIEIDWVKVKE
jgi:hypothetical protein